jgi:hypothetical protein
MYRELAVGIVSTLLLAALGTAFRHRQYLKPALRCLFFCHNKKLRVSMAAILSIRRDDRHILVRNLHRPERFGPIGGVYKYYPSAPDQLDRCHFRPQVREQNTRNDLRGFMQGKDFPAFMRWFLSGKNREVEPLTRELVEELKEVGLTREAEGIRVLQYELLNKVYEGPENIPGVDYMQFRYFGIYRLNPSDPKGEELTDTLFGAAEHNPDLIAVTADEIMQRRAASGEVIGTHAGYLIGGKRTGPEPPPFMA